MTHNLSRWFIFGIIVLIQLAVPTWMIQQHEQVLAQGQVFRFKTAPVDPYDLFRGRYVALRIASDSASFPADSDEFKAMALNSAENSAEKAGVHIIVDASWAPGRDYFVSLKTDKQGVTSLYKVLKDPPETTPYLKLKVSSSEGTKLYFEMPFDRFYLEEKLAPAVESAYQDMSRTDNQQAYISVKVLDGRGVIEELYLDNLPAREYIQQQASKAQN